MLPSVHRMRRRGDFTATVRAGHRAGGRLLVLHARTEPASSTPALVGFIVPKAVGNAVIRNRTERRLRHAVRSRLAGLPPGSTLVVRVLPAAGSADFADLETEIDRGLERLDRRHEQERARVTS